METSVEQIKNSQRRKKFVIGSIVVIAGLLLLGFNFDILPYSWKHVVFSWQMLLIAIGTLILSGSRRDSLTPGMILILIGTFFIIPEIFIMHISFVRLFWPFILIAIGLMILTRRGFQERWHRRHNHNPLNISTTPIEEGYIDEVNIFSGSKHRVVNQVFKGGKVTNIFGGTEIDLMSATIPEGRTELTIECIFGGVTLIVPADLKVVLNVTAVMGGFSDKRLVIKEPSDANRILVIRGSAIFGGGEIKSY